MFWSCGTSCPDCCYSLSSCPNLVNVQCARNLQEPESLRLQYFYPIPVCRSLGWDNYSDYNSNQGNLFHKTRTFGHTGYTGTSFIVDPVSKTAVILLAHRVHPADKGSVARLRALVANVVAGSIVE